VSAGRVHISASLVKEKGVKYAYVQFFMIAITDFSVLLTILQNFNTVRTALVCVSYTINTFLVALTQNGCN